MFIHFNGVFLKGHKLCLPTKSCPMSLALELSGCFCHKVIKSAKLGGGLRKMFFDDVLPLYANPRIVLYVCLRPNLGVLVCDVPHTKENLYQRS